MDVSALLAKLGPDLGFGGVAGAVVGYTAKKVTKLVALALGLVFIVIQALVYLNYVSVNWAAVQSGAEHLWSDAQGVTLADRAWAIVSANLPFGAAFAAGFALGFKLG
ncbi:MAG: FUN14 domain-containing protein [Deltaproteobacteria bacterium]|nr:FUN14 domain-containing protein [Deltaproteobacteria bacterium]